jgi:hypothetical protein
MAQINQGVINKLRASVVFADNPTLNVINSFLTKEAISLSFQGEVGRLLPTMTGGVQSPEPYQMADVRIHLNRANGLADLFKQQIELDANIGSLNVIPDTAALSNYEIEQGIIVSVDELPFDGNTAGFVVRLQGIYYINSTMWAGT